LLTHQPDGDGDPTRQTELKFPGRNRVRKKFSHRCRLVVVVLAAGATEIYETNSCKFDGNLDVQPGDARRCRTGPLPAVLRLRQRTNFETLAAAWLNQVERALTKCSRCRESNTQPSRQNRSGKTNVDC